MEWRRKVEDDVEDAESDIITEKQVKEKKRKR